MIIKILPFNFLTLQHPLKKILLHQVITLTIISSKYLGIIWAPATAAFLHVRQSL